MLSNLLMYRLLITNAVCASFVVWAWIQGRVAEAFTGDAAFFGAVMTAMFAVCMVSLFIRAWKVSQGLNDLKEGLEVDARKFAIKNSHLGYAATVIITISLIGNVDGMTTALKGFITADAEAKADLMAVGMDVAFNATKIGLTLGVWLGLNYQILKTATALLMVDARHAR